MNTDEMIIIPRDKVFVLRDGTFVVQWETNQIQNLVSGKYLPFDDSQYGYAITDYELNQLKHIGIVAHYDAIQVTLSAHKGVMTSLSKRSYYLNTTLSKTHLSQIELAFSEANLDTLFSLRIRDDFVVIWAQNGLAFQHFEDAEKARLLLVATFPDLLQETVVAFVEVVLRG